MGRLETVIQLIREGRREELRAALDRQTFPPRLYRRNEMLLVRATAIQPLPRPLSGFDIRWGTPEDERHLQRVRQRAAGYRRQFEQGHFLIYGETGGEPASFSWIEPGPVHVSTANAYRFQIPPGAGWAYGFEVAPKFRMSGLFHKHWAEAFRLLRERGIERVYGAIEADHANSIRSHQRAGFELLYRVKVLRLAGCTWHDVRPGDGRAGAPSRGFGAWSGRDPDVQPVS